MKSEFTPLRSKKLGIVSAATLGVIFVSALTHRDSGLEQDSSFYPSGISKEVMLMTCEPEPVPYYLPQHSLVDENANTAATPVSEQVIFGPPIPAQLLHSLTPIC